MKAMGHILLAALLGLGALAGAATQKSPAVMLQEALYQEQTEGNLDKAIELYSEVIEQAADVERVAARATYQLGLCHLKKGETEEAAKYFRQVIQNYPTQVSAVKKAQSQLEKIAPQQPKDSVFDQIGTQPIRFIAEQFGKTATEAYPQNLQANGHVYYVDAEGYHYSGGLNSYYNWTGQTINQKVKLTSMTGSDYTFYDAAGQELNVEFHLDNKETNHYTVYWTPETPLAPGQFLYYGWSSNSRQKLSKSSDKPYTLWMKNHYGDAVLETFFLVLPKTVKISDAATPPSGSENLLDFNVYWWSKQVPEGETHVESVSLISLRDASPQEVANIVEKTVLTISTCAETDPRIKKAMESLADLREGPVVTALTPYLDSETAAIRRATIYTLWKGGFSDISAAEQKLLELCEHPENATRGMAALAVGEYKVKAAYDTLVNMTLKDKDGFARRCGAYALGLLGNQEALPVLEQALNDPEELVKGNAQAAITMLTIPDEEPSDDLTLEPLFTQEMYSDIQPDGTIRFKNPQQVVNKGIEPITEQRFINSDFVQLTAITDEQGNPIEFTSTHQNHHYSYVVTFDPPIMPGQTRVYISEGTISGLIKPVAGKENTYRYYMNHSPSTGVPTLRIETYLLPEGAEVVSTLSDGMKQGITDGRIELRVEEVVPANGSLLTSFQYTLER